MRRIQITALLLSFLFGTCSTITLAEETDWPQWRGPKGTGVVGQRKVPLNWGPQENVVWKAEIPGFGASTPAIWNESVFLTTQVEDDLLALCLDRSTGKPKWSKTVGTGRVRREGPKGTTKYHRLHNMASPSPVTDGSLVFFHFGNGDLLGFDFLGNRLWKRNLSEDFGHYTIWWGHANSPVLFGDLIISVCMQDPIAKAPSYLVAHEKRTGELRWHTVRDTGARAESADSYTTPLLVEREGRTELVIMGGNVLDAYDPETGEKLWEKKGLDGGRTITGPTTAEGVFFATHGMRGQLVALKPVRGQVETLWSHTTSTPDTPSPVYAGGLLFTITDNGIASCFNAESGELHWRERIRGDFKASPVVVGDHVFFQNLKGVTTIVKAAAKFHQVSQNELGEETIASPAIASDQLFLRGKTHLWCIGDSKE